MTYANERVADPRNGRQQRFEQLEIVREARRVVVHEYRFGGPPAHVSDAVLAYLAGDGGLLRALTDLEEVLDELYWEHRRGGITRFLPSVFAIILGQVISPMGRES